MKALEFLVVHRSPIVGESIMLSLARFRHLMPLGVVTTIEASVDAGRHAGAVVIDGELSGAAEAAAALRRTGTRVVLLGDGVPEDHGVAVPTTGTIADLARALAPNYRPPRATTRLTPRETQVLELVGRGLAAKQVAQHLGISQKTVEQHKSRIFAKLGVPNQTAAVSFLHAGATERSTRWIPSTI